MKKLALFDIDRTIYSTQLLFKLVENEVQKGRVSTEAWEEIQNVFKAYKAKELTYSITANKLLGIFANELKGEKYEDLYRDMLGFFSANKQNFYPYFEKIIPKLKETHDVYIITGNSQFLAEAVVNLFQLSGFIASEFELENGIFTGKVLKSLANGKELVSSLVDKYGSVGSIAVGDSENDVGMLELVEFPMCVNPTLELQKVAAERGWRAFEADDAEGIFRDVLDSVH